MAEFERIREEQNWQPAGPSTTSFESMGQSMGQSIDEWTDGNIKARSSVALRSQPALSSDVAAGPARLASGFHEALRQFDQMDPAVQLLLDNADLLMKNGEHRLAQHLLRTLLVRWSDCDIAIEKMGLCLRELGQLEDSLKCFKALTKVRRDAHSMSQYAEALYLLERDAHALEAYREALRLVVTDETRLFATYKNIGNIHTRSGDLEAAEEFYNKAFVIFPASDVLLVNYGTLEIQREQFEAAIERFRAAVAINGNNDKAWTGLALLHRQKGDAELATANIERALDIASDNRTALKLCVDWAAQDSRLSNCIVRLETYLNANGEDAEIAFTLAKVLTHQGHLCDARIELERVLALDPEMEGAANLARILDQEILKASLAEIAKSRVNA